MMYIDHIICIYNFTEHTTAYAIVKPTNMPYLLL